MEIKRTPYRVITLTKDDCSDIEEAIAFAMKLLDGYSKELTGKQGKGPALASAQAYRHRNRLLQLRTSVVDIGF